MIAVAIDVDDLADGRRVVGPYLPFGQPSGTTAHGETLHGSPSARRARKVLQQSGG